jgi:hypothetical protein
MVMLMLALAGCSSPTPTVEVSAEEVMTLPPEATPAPTEGAEEPTSEPTPEEVEEPPGEEGDLDMPFALTSEAFDPEGPIPPKYTCDGEDLSPPLSWGEPPTGTQSFALAMDDPDAPVGTWDHWVLYNIPAETRNLPEGVPPEATLSDGSRHGENSWGRLDYGGPCPPGGTHRYFFRLYALDTILDLEPGASKEELLATMQGHILAHAELMGRYARQ